MSDASNGSLHPVGCLFVAYAYPPISAPGAVRITRALKHFDRSKIDPWVLTVADGHSLREGGLDDPLAEEPERVIRVRDPLGGAAASARSAMAATDGRESLTRKTKRRLLEFASSLLVPDRRMLWALRCFSVARQLRGKGISVIYSTSPSPANHFVGYVLARRLGAKWIAEFRDPLSWLTEASRTSWIKRKFLAAIEGWAVRRASIVPVVSEPFAEYFRSRYPGANIVSIPNGADISPAEIEEVLSERARRPKSELLKIVHAGSLYGGDRDPSPVIAAALAAEQRYGTRLRVVFAGNDTHLALEAARRLDALHLVEDAGQRTFSETQNLLRAADVSVILLNAGGLGKIGIMSKFFDYLAAGAPILVLGPKDAALSRIIAEEGAGAAFEADEIDQIGLWLSKVHALSPIDLRGLCKRWSGAKMATAIEQQVLCVGKASPRVSPVEAVA